MYKCLDCGHEFEDPKFERESYGQEFGYCPHCGSSAYRDTDLLKCSVCGEMMEDPDECYCEDCKHETRVVVTDAFSDIAHLTDLTLGSAWRAYKDAVNDTPSKRIILNLMANSIIALATELDCGFDTAYNMISEYVNDNRLMKLK